MRICGLTCFYSIQYSKTPKKDKRNAKLGKKAPRKRTLHVRCVCGHVQKSPLLNKKEVKVVAPSDSLRETKRKKKKSELSALLEKKRENEKIAKPTLDLMAFMQ